VRVLTLSSIRITNSPVEGIGDNLTDSHVVVTGLGKAFGRTRALDGVDVEIRRGEVHALVGQNGAGKSTLGKILGGVLSHDRGTLLVDGRAVRYSSPRAAIRDGIAMIEQELTLMPNRSVLENVFLGDETRRFGLVSRAALRERLRKLNEESGFDLPADAPVRSLRMADRQKVEILRALSRHAKLIVMDEPTAVLDPAAVQQLCGVIRRLRERGTTVVYVSHFLDEILLLADRVTILRDGQVVRTSIAAEERPDSLVTAMLGRPLDSAFPDKLPPEDGAPVQFAASGVHVPRAVDAVSLEVRRGEILGIAGLVGSGRSELLHAIYGSGARSGGSFELDGTRIDVRSPRDAIGHGLAMLPESRKEQGLVLTRSIRENVSLAQLDAVSSRGWLRKDREGTLVDAVVEALQIRCTGTRARVGTLSGGNQQKVLLGKCIAHRPRVLLADEPTRGVDVGSKRAIYDALQRLASEGTSVILASSEIDELLGLAHRVLVMHRGRVVRELRDNIGEEQIMAAAFNAMGDVAA
jgi:ABC-type sugar transport system ATPase subunit